MYLSGGKVQGKLPCVQDGLAHVMTPEFGEIAIFTESLKKW